MRRVLLAVIGVLALLAAPTMANAAVGFARTDVPAGGQVLSLAVGDMDGQHGPDIVAAINGVGLSVRLNNGDGTFAAPMTTTIAPGCNPVQVLLGDVTSNGVDLAQDGKLDAVVSCEDGRIGRLAGDGAGGLGTLHYAGEFIIASGSLLPFEGRIALVRWRDAGPPVLLFGSLGYDFHNNATYGALCVTYDWVTRDYCSATHSDDPHTFFGGPIASGDINGGGFDEVATPGGSEGLQVLGIDSHAYDWADRQFGVSMPGGRTMLAVGDLEPDGHPDIVTGAGSSLGGDINVLHGSATGLAPQTPAAFPSVAGLSSIAIGDFDGDGHNDVLGATQYGRAVVQSGDGAGNLGPPQDVPLVGYGNPAYATTVSLAKADLDGNGSLDAIVADQGAGILEVLRNTVPAYVPPPGAPGSGAAGAVTPQGKAKLRPLSGLRGLKGAVTVSPGGILKLGSVANPPTQLVELALKGAAGPPPAGASAAKRQRLVTLGSAKITVPAGKVHALTIKLNKKAAASVNRQGSLAAALSIRAVGTDGTSATATRSLTIKRAAKRR